MARYIAWLFHPKSTPGDRWQMTEEVFVRVFSTLVVLIVIAAMGALLAPLVVRLVITLAFLCVGLLVMALGLHLMGVRWNWRRFRR